MLIDRELESAAVERWERVDSFTKRNPARDFHFTGRRAEEKNFLAGWADPAADHVRKQRRQPRAAGEDESFRELRIGMIDAARFIVRTCLQSCLDHGLHGTAREQGSAARLVDSRCAGIEGDLRITALEAGGFEPVEFVSRSSEDFAACS